MWISTKEQLPEEGKYVLARYGESNWHDSSDQENVNCIVVKLKKGISLEEREKMEKGELPDPTEKGWCLSDGWRISKRSNCYFFEDEHSNNKVPYAWKTFGPETFFGQNITHWQPIESL